MIRILVCAGMLFATALPCRAKSQGEFDDTTAAGLKWLYNWVQLQNQSEPEHRYIGIGDRGATDKTCPDFNIRVTERQWGGVTAFRFEAKCDVSFNTGENTVTVTMFLHGVIGNQGRTLTLFDPPYMPVRGGYPVEPDYKVLSVNLSGRINEIVAEKKKPYCIGTTNY